MPNPDRFVNISLNHNFKSFKYFAFIFCKKSEIIMQNHRTVFYRISKYTMIELKVDNDKGTSGGNALCACNDKKLRALDG